MAEFTTDFTAADNTTLTSLGWSVPPSGTSMVVTGNRARASVGFTVRMLAPFTPDSADYWVESDIDIDTYTSSANGGVMVREQGVSSFSAYLLRLNSTNNTWRLDAVIAGTVSTLASAPANVASGQRHRLRLEVSGTSLTASVNGEVVIAETDDRITAMGKPGLWVDDTSPTAIFFDNFATGDPVVIPQMYYSPDGTTLVPADMLHSVDGLALA